MNQQIENIIKKEKIESELAIFWNKMSDYLPKSFERSALGDKKIFIALKQAYIEFRPLIADEVLKVVVEKIEEMKANTRFMSKTDIRSIEETKGYNQFAKDLLSNLSTKENKNNE